MTICVRGQLGMSDLKEQVAVRFSGVNGTDPMSAADETYVRECFMTLEDLCALRSMSCDVLREHMLARRLPLPSYIRSDGAEMVPADLLELAERAGGIRRLSDWFTSHWSDRQGADQEGNAYLDRLYGCLRSVTPGSIQRKARPIDPTNPPLVCPRPDYRPWVYRLHDPV